MCACADPLVFGHGCEPGVQSPVSARPEDAGQPMGTAAWLEASLRRERDAWLAWSAGEYSLPLRPL